ncbi:hypothetical protein, partial [Cellulomonas iranensis]|uniref:hypothetical protein n=1 Tax=Cellulomonas iranensis TaxID=76862 RepID=UPI001969FB57
MTRATELVRHAVLGVTTAAAMLVEDPALLAVQASRRAPRSLARRAAALLRRGARGRRRDARLGLAAWLTGHRDVARTHVAAALAAPGGRV